MILHDRIHAVFLRSLEQGLLRSKHLRLVLDITPNPGTEYGQGYNWEAILKGSAEVDWSDPDAHRRFLATIVADAEWLLDQVLTSPEAADHDHPARASILEEAGWLCKLLLQDIDRRPDRVAVREGVAKDRIVSVHEPEMRPSRKRSQHCFKGRKAALAVEAETVADAACGMATHGVVVLALARGKRPD
ncbi:MAG: hypothetical protein F4Y80_01145 [Caldilineaceae bacterium SB0665_bin_21]|nr:hypothetical protein [Caldilineaceae bacterium SB0665_bin_21]